MATQPLFNLERYVRHDLGRPQFAEGPELRPFMGPLDR